jgi:hypothetical protein
VRKKLILSDGTRERELQLVGRIVVGRDPACEVSHDDSLLSRRHAEFLTVGDAVTVRDLGSRNGVFVNGARAAEHRLEAGDVVQIGPLRARYVIDGAPSSIVPEDMDAERTAIFRRPVDLPVPPETSESVGTPAVISALPAVNFDSVAEFDSEEEEVTRLVPAPRMPKPAPAVSPPPAPQVSPAPLAISAVGESDDEITQFSRAPRFSIPPATPVPPSVTVAPAAPLTAPLPEVQQTRIVATAQRAPVVPASSGGFVYFAVGTLAFIVLAASAPFLEAASATALAIPVGVAIVGSILVGALINRRITRALAAVERKGI